MKILNLAGSWRFAADEQNQGYAQEYYRKRLPGEGFMLPGSACENGIGKKQEWYQDLNRDTVRCLREKYSYTGALWLQREICVPEEFRDRYITLYLERVNIASELWIDGEKIDRQIISLSAPHIYRLTGRISPGPHTVTLRIDNSDLIHMDGMASGYSLDTQGIWCGIIGKIELRCEEIFHISNLQLFPNRQSVTVRLTAAGDCPNFRDRKQVKVRLTAFRPDGTSFAAAEYDRVLFQSRQILHLEYPMDGEITYWDEFHPAVYTMKAELVYGESVNRHAETFGMRTVEAKGREFLLNGRPIALRGTLDCGIHPLTGYPPVSEAEWEWKFRQIKQYGLNHVRFHAWCPPEAAFAAADRVGIYLQAEMPLWLNRDVCALETGDDPAHALFYHREALNISRFYGNHPSFLFFSNGNELMGDFEMLEQLTEQIKALDGRRLYTLTSNFDRPVTPADDYFSAFEANGMGIRAQMYADVISEHTRLSYQEQVENMPVPIVSFEVGQYCVYPDVDSVKDYSGCMMPVNFEVIRRSMTAAGVYPMLSEYIKASGRLAALLYKEDIESVLRTERMGGFQLLGISDYTGQCTATVGILDAFWKSKGIIEPEEFREFCSPVVPLLMADRVFTSDECLDAQFMLYDYGEEFRESITFTLNLYAEGRLLKSLCTDERHVKVPLDFIRRPSVLEAELLAGGHKNRWNLYVYPSGDIECAVPVLKADSLELEELLIKGGRAVVTADGLNKPIQGTFTPVFWSPAYFPSDNSCGVLCDSGHPALQDFPTERYGGFQWRHPLEHSLGAPLTGFPEGFSAIVEPVPNFVSNIRRSPLFEARVENAEILFCGFDLSVEEKTVKQLKNSIYRYVSSGQFHPVQRLDRETFMGLFGRETK